MTLEVSINLGSLKLIQNELSEAIKRSASDFETYIESGEDGGLTESCKNDIAQVGGTFRLLEYPGAALIADEMAELVGVIADPERKTTKAMINALTHAYFVLPRYIEYITQRQSELPILVIPYVNEMRVSRKEDLLPEYHGNTGNINFDGEWPSTGPDADVRLLLATVPRLRYMYQTGLVGILKHPGSGPHYLFMSRAVARIIALLGNHPQSELWRLFALVLDAMAAEKLEITLNRKRDLASVEKLMRGLVSQKEEGLTQDTAQLKKNLLFMLMLTSHDGEAIDTVRQLYSLATPDVNDDQIVAERIGMHGPSQETVETVIKVLSEELRNAKDILELGSQNNGVEEEDLALLKEIVGRVADTLQILNLYGPQETLKAQLEKINRWENGFSDSALSGFIGAADTLLYIESALEGLDRQQLTVAELNEATELTRKKIIAGSQLAQAEQLVIEEAQTSIAMVKRAITSYVDSNFDAAHVANVHVALNTVRGGLYMLNSNRAAAVVKSCSAFLFHHIDENNTGEQRHQLLETLADALISLEYYLIEMGNSRDVNDDILRVAEDSLEALGYKVEPIIDSRAV
ncbi:MAG: hypothetical protein V7459_02420 [Oceanicoccus sp.]